MGAAVPEMAGLKRTELDDSAFRRDPEELENF